ncbi:DUF6531 domain-containing protein [Arthrobacter sp. YD2]|uniref:DUF6531 domain-containing protein n=1 Tax=Arthrobacter sp. YD2 TaxID=3058046 RepID=UPI0025B57790|nr:DUF6531 domain-containing protein [Arthrobacter sp. YD2]MDN3905926.1 DUF6531 domain-containing protein [Arthrobacter sp. YD2]
MDSDVVEMKLLPESPVGYGGGPFNFSVAWEAATAFDNEAQRIYGQSGSRAALVSEGKTDFQGYFSELFQTNAVTAAKSAEDLAGALSSVAGLIREVIFHAEQENNRRKENNEYIREYRNRNGWEKFLDWWNGGVDGEEPPNTDPLPGPVFSSVAPIVGVRNDPNPGSGGYGGGTSSARPNNLRTFADGSHALDDELKSAAVTLDNHLSTLKDQCRWGAVDASGVMRAYRDYLTANSNDVRWARLVAGAFESAGSNGGISVVSDAALASSLAAAGVDIARDGLTIDPPEAYGAVPTTGYANDPVNTATGNFIEPETDLACSGASSNLVLSRMYNSLAPQEAHGVFGPGWSSVLDQELVLSDEGGRWILADGRAMDFPREGDGWGRAVGENYWLTREPVAAGPWSELSLPEGTAEILLVKNNEGSWWAYTQAGVWLGAGSGPGRTMSVHREDSSDDTGVPGRVTRLSHVRGRFIDVEYVNGRAAVVRASDGRRAEYGYDDAGRLISVTTETGTRTYRWNDAGLIDAVYSAAGVLEAENTYDEQGRVILQLTQHGRRTRFAYLPGRVTVVSDEDGTRSNSWIADTKGRLVGVLDSHDQRQSMAYDRHGNLVSLTERDGSVTVHAYDDRGRRIRTVTPEGADLTYGWDEQDRITTVVTESGSVVTYEYADDLTRDPAVILDPLGGRTELTWEGGLLTRITDPVGVTVAFEHDVYGDLVATRNALGETARILRDSAGRPLESVMPSGAATRFTYNAAGLLVRREEADGAVWTFEHDAAGRITASIAPDGGRTELQYAANGELVRTIDPLGRTNERVFDELGNVTAAILPDGARWGFTHDSLSRLTGVTDPDGHDWVREYDRIGHLTAVVDPTGVRAEARTDRKGGRSSVSSAFATSGYSFDAYGRPIREEAEDGSAKLVTYDAAGNPVELVDGEGGLTRLGRDVSGKIISVTSPSGAVTRYEYDICGRPWKTVDPLGAVTELVYDADQRVAARILPTGEAETFEYDLCGRLVLRLTPGQGNARYGYDKAGRLNFSQDSWYGTRRFRYNAAGELVETVNGVGGRTRFEYDLRGRLVRVTDPLGGVTTRTYTETDKVESVSDPLGRVTTATYDPAGRQLSQTDPDGNTTTWVYDAAGREESTSYNGKLLASAHRDGLNRRVVVTDYTGADGLTVEHELGFNRRGQLVSRTRGGQGLSWNYDADGNRTSFTDAAGTTTTYLRDAVGRVTTVRNPRLGEAVFAYDPAGRLTGATAGELVQEWEYRNGYIAEHTRTDRAETDSPSETTLIGRDGDGRITGLTRAGAVTRYGYDNAGQLVAAATTGSSATSVFEWEYDAGGRLVREMTPDGPRNYNYDAAGQLTAVTNQDGSRTEYVHDGLGRRSRLIGPDGSWTEYAWGPTGYLQVALDRTPDGTETRRHEVWVDALGELSSVDSCPVWWDSASSIPALAGFGSEQVLTLPGGVTGMGEGWLAPGWRAARATDQADPWAVLGASVIPGPGMVSGSGSGLSGMAGGLPAGIGLTADGGLDIAGLEWLGARAYDPAARGFLSTDPLAPVLGAGWDGNPYSYAGNNPLNASDPTGLSPLTDAELADFQKSLGSHWEYVAAGAAVALGVALMFTGVGGPVGVALIGAASGALISGGMSIATSKAQNGTVDWAQAGKDALVGGLGGLAGGVAAGALTKGAVAAARTASASGASQAVQTAIRKATSSTVRGVLSAGVSGATSGVADYRLNTPDGERTAGGYIQAGGVGFVVNAGFGYGSGKLSEVATARLPIPPLPPGANAHVAPTSPWAPIVEDAVGRVAGVTQAVIEETIDAGGIPSSEDLVPAIISGGLNGSGGPIVQHHELPN